MNAPITVRDITAEEHLAWLRTQPSASFLQTPAWGEVKRDWRHESVGWFEGGQMVGAALVLHRSLPRVKRSLAYVPEGPCIDWGSPRLVELLRALRDHLKSKGAFALRLGPPVATHRWDAATIKEAIADDAVRRYDDAPPSTSGHRGALRRRHAASGWASATSPPTTDSRPGSRSTSSRCRSPAAPRQTCSRA